MLNVELSCYYLEKNQTLNKQHTIINKQEKKQKMENKNIELLKDAVTVVLKNIYDPEIPVNIYDLGLIYKIDIDEKYNVNILMTLTSANCPVAESLPVEVNKNLRNIKRVNKVKVELTFEPPWDQKNISNEAKLELGLL